MEGKLIFGSELHELLQSVVCNSGDCLSEMESDLLQVNLLLMEAINKLGDNVLEIGRNLDSQKQVINQMVKMGNGSPFIIEQLDELGQSVDEGVASVITAMQFQDITSQLLDKVLGRVRCLREVLDEVEKLAGGITKAGSDSDVLAMIHEASLAMHIKHEQMKAIEVQNVMQSHMDPGSIDLF